MFRHKSSHFRESFLFARFFVKNVKTTYFAEIIGEF
jgi:hypothetical protein